MAFKWVLRPWVDIITLSGHYGLEWVVCALSRCYGLGEYTTFLDIYIWLCKANFVMYRNMDLMNFGHFFSFFFFLPYPFEVVSELLGVWIATSKSYYPIHLILIEKWAWISLLCFTRFRNLNHSHWKFDIHVLMDLFLLCCFGASDCE